MCGHTRTSPFTTLLAVGSEGPYVAYVSEQNLLPDAENGPVAHPAVDEVFSGLVDGSYIRMIPLN